MLKYLETLRKGLRILKNLIDKFKRFISKQTKETPQEFIHENNVQLLKRLNIVSIILTILYLFYLYADFVMLNSVENTLFRYILIVIHLLSLFISIIYLCIYPNIKKSATFINSKKATILIVSYISMYLLLGAAGSINSQNFSGNIDAYITIVIGVAVLFHLSPIFLIPAFLIAHLILYIGLLYTVHDSADLVTKQINSTATVIIALFIGIIFYSNKKKEYFHQENFAKLFEINPYPLVLTKINDGKIVKINQRALRFYGKNEDELDKVRAGEFYKNEKQRVDMIEQLKNYGFVKNLVLEQKTANGEYKWVQLNYELVEYGGEQCILAGVTDVTSLKEIEAELMLHATIDPLTGIRNRRSGLQYLNELLVNSKTSGESFILCFIDVNNLKIVNDKYGHAEGDNLIKTVCQIIQEQIEEQDLFFRYGGDEFIIVFTEKEVHEVHQLWERIVVLLSETTPKPYQISVSHGLISYDPNQDMTLQEMIEQADQEMYREKQLLKRLV